MSATRPSRPRVAPCEKERPSRPKLAPASGLPGSMRGIEALMRAISKSSGCSEASGRPAVRPGRIWLSAKPLASTAPAKAPSIRSARIAPALARSASPIRSGSISVSRSTAPLQPPVLQGGDAGGIVAAIFQPLEPVEQPVGQEVLARPVQRGLVAVGVVERIVRVEAMPLAATGKIDKTQLRAIYGGA